MQVLKSVKGKNTHTDTKNILILIVLAGFVPNIHKIFNIHSVLYCITFKPSKLDNVNIARTEFWKCFCLSQKSSISSTQITKCNFFVCDMWGLIFTHPLCNQWSDLHIALVHNVVGSLGMSCRFVGKLIYGGMLNKTSYSLITFHNYLLILKWN